MEGMFNFFAAYGYDFTAVVLSAFVVYLILRFGDIGSPKAKWILTPCCFILGAMQVVQDILAWVFAMFPVFHPYVVAAVILTVGVFLKKKDKEAGIWFMAACFVLGTSPAVTGWLPPLVNGAITIAAAFFGQGYAGG